MEEQQKRVGLAIRAYRKRFDLSISELARRTGLSESGLWKAQQGSDLRASTVMRLCVPFECQPNDLLLPSDELVAEGLEDEERERLRSAGKEAA